MCAVSATIGYFQEHQPVWTRPDFDSFKKVLKRLEVLDKHLGQPDCIDPSKAEYLREIEERLNRLEEKAKSRG